MNPDGSYTSTNPWYRSLTPAEVAAFRAYAQAYDPPPGDNGWDGLHPVCRMAWRERGLAEGGGA